MQIKKKKQLSKFFNKKIKKTLFFYLKKAVFDIYKGKYEQIILTFWGIKKNCSMCKK